MKLTNIIVLVAGLTGHVWLTILLLKRRAWRSFRIFACYQVFAVVAVSARLLAVFIFRHDPYGYFYTYWTTELGFLLLAIAASHEVFRWVFSGFYLLQWFRWFYYGGIFLTVAIAGVNAAMHHPANDDMGWWVFSLGIVINSIQSAIFALFYLLARLLDISFRRYAFGIALGLGVAAVGTVISYAIRSEIGTKIGDPAVYGPTVAYFVSLIVWLSAFMGAVPEPEAWEPPMPPEQMADEVRRYMDVLKGFFRKEPS